MSHSWFYYFETRMPNVPLPNLFLEWWTIFGLIQEIVPHDLNVAFQQWAFGSFGPSSIDKNLPSLFKLYLSFTLPWILHWDYVIIPDSPSN